MKIVKAFYNIKVLTDIDLALLHSTYLSLCTILLYLKPECSTGSVAIFNKTEGNNNSQDFYEEHANNGL